MIKKTTKKLILFIICLFSLNIISIAQNKEIIKNEKINTLNEVVKNIEINYEVPNKYLEKNNNLLLFSINSKLGRPYRWGSIGPNSYDCSGFVWKIFNENNIIFNRSTVKEYYRKFKPVFNNDRFITGTLVFFSNLKHIGIVLNKEGFYHASSSKGITYSKFNSYWNSRIVGFRRVN